MKSGSGNVSGRQLGEARAAYLYIAGGAEACLDRHHRGPGKNLALD
jgi:hypothetical protein